VPSFANIREAAKRTHSAVILGRKYYGWPGSVVVACRLVDEIFSFGSVEHRIRFSEAATDLWLGADTRRRPGDNPIDYPTAPGESEGYIPINLGWWVRMLAALPISPREFTFVDLGAGRGRAVVLAAKAGFRRVVGVEIDAGLAADAERNLERRSYRARAERGRAAPWSVVVKNAVDYEIPDGPVLIFMFNPFGEDAIRRCLSNIVKRSGSTAPVYVLYGYPVHAHVFAEFPTLRRCEENEHWSLYRLT
jgi:hypothetical protein